METVSLEACQRAILREEALFSETQHFHGEMFTGKGRERAFPEKESRNTHLQLHGGTQVVC